MKLALRTLLFSSALLDLSFVGLLLLSAATNASAVSLGDPMRDHAYSPPWFVSQSLPWSQTHAPWSSAFAATAPSTSIKPTAASFLQSNFGPVQNLTDNAGNTTVFFYYEGLGQPAVFLPSCYYGTLARF